MREEDSLIDWKMMRGAFRLGMQHPAHVLLKEM